MFVWGVLKRGIPESVRFCIGDLPMYIFFIPTHPKWKLTRMRVDHVKDLWICHGSATDLLWSTTVTQGQVCGCPFDCFNRQTRSMSIRSRSGYVLGDICWHGSVTDETDATMTSRMVIQTIRTLTDEIRKNYGYCVRTDFPEKSGMFDFSVMV